MKTNSIIESQNRSASSSTFLYGVFGWMGNWSFFNLVNSIFGLFYAIITGLIKKCKWSYWFWLRHTIFAPYFFGDYVIWL